MKCDICGTPVKVSYPWFREIEYQCDCKNPEHELVQMFDYDEDPIFWSDNES